MSTTLDTLRTLRPAEPDCVKECENDAIVKAWVKAGEIARRRQAELDISTAPPKASWLVVVSLVALVAVALIVVFADQIDGVMK